MDKRKIIMSTFTLIDFNNVVVDSPFLLYELKELPLYKTYIYA
jgi:hypothetical protein